MMEFRIKKKESLTNQFLKYLLAIIIVSNFLVFGCMSFITQKNMAGQARNSSHDLMKANLKIIEQYFGEIDNIATSIIYNKDVIKFLKTKQDVPSELELIYGIESLYYNSRPDLTLTFYKANTGNSMYTLGHTKDGMTIKDYRYSNWYQTIIWTKDQKIVDVSQDENGDNIYSIVYKVENIYDSEMVGFLKIDMDLYSVKEQFLHGYSKIAGASICSEDGTVLFYDKEPVTVPESVYKENTAGEYENSKYIMSYGISESTGWRLCMAQSKEELFHNQKQMLLALALILMLIITGTILLSNKCFNIITVNFKRLVWGMEEVKKGNLKTQVEAETSDEISILIQQFNDMMQRVNTLVHTVESKQILLKEAEIKALQQQINPHFMHNIMETIMGLASEGMDREVIKVSKCMSSMLRYNTTFENTTTIREELKQVQNYVTVLKIRFEDRFEVYYDVDEECLEYEIVKLTLQPMVENAISHGLRDTYSGGMLRIRIKLEDEKISISIYDNGTGIQKEQLEELNSRLQDTSEHPLQYIEQYKSLGILNVHLRFKLYFGDDYSMEIFSKDNRGTCISIEIPISSKAKE